MKLFNSRNPFLFNIYFIQEILVNNIYVSDIFLGTEHIVGARLCYCPPRNYALERNIDNKQLNK